MTKLEKIAVTLIYAGLIAMFAYGVVCTWDASMRGLGVW